MKKIRLGDIATLITKGTTPTTIGFSFVDTGVNFVKIESISENGEFLSDKFAHITDECDNKLKRSQLEENDILFSIAGAIGRTAIVPRSILPANTNQALAIIRIPQNAINLRFVLYALQSQAVEEQSEKQKQGVAQLNLSLKNIADILIPLVSSEKQDEIVRNLAAVDTAIAIRKEQIRLIDQVVKSRFIELFGDPETNPKGWTRQRLDQICENLDSRRVPITSTNRKAGNYPYYGASGIVDYVKDYIFDEDILLISEDGANLVMRSTPIAFSVSGKVWVNNHAHVVRFESKATQKYIEICFALTDISGSITGTAQPKLNQAKLNAMMFCVPPIELQEQFATFVKQTDKSKYYSSLSFRYCQAAANTYRQEWMTCRTSDF